MKSLNAKVVETIPGEKLPPLVKEFDSRVFGSDTKGMPSGPPTYDELQGFYSKLGNALSKGSLDGETYHAYDVLHEGIAKEMQRIADDHGMGEQLNQAREYWRRMKQTFGKPFNKVPGRAGDAVKDANSPYISAQEQEYTNRLIGSFDPEIPKLLEAAKAARDRMDALPTETATRGMVKPFPEPPEPKPLPGAPELKPKEPEKKIGTEDIQKAKGEAFQKRGKHLTQGLQWGAGGMAVFRILADVAHGNIGAVPSGLLEGGLAVGGIEAVSRLMENPRVIEALTRPTERDIAAIPPEMRGDLRPIVEAAVKKGIKVDPKLLAAVGVGASVQGPRTQELQRMRQSQ